MNYLIYSLINWNFTLNQFLNLKVFIAQRMLKYDSTTVGRYFNFKVSGWEPILEGAGETFSYSSLKDLVSFRLLSR